MSLLERATDPEQYDKELDWSMMTSSSPSRRFHLQYLEKELPDLSQQTVIDIGCGTGYLYDTLKNKGAKEVYGIEPSSKNNQICAKLSPELIIYKCSLQEAPEEKKFDQALAMLVFEHLPELKSAFKKIRGLLKNSGKLCIMVGEFEYLTAKRFNYPIRREPLENGEMAIATKRSNGTLHDIARPLHNYVTAAKEEGFRLVKHIPMIPTKEYLAEEPKYKKFEGKPLFHLLFFKIDQHD